jgi:hypothetical protein
MPERRKPWSLRRWRRRWKDRRAALALRWRIWYDRHILSQARRREWRRRWQRRSTRLGRAVEQVGFKLLPQRRDATAESRWTRGLRQFESLLDQRVYPAEARLRHRRALRQGWRDFSAPFRHGNAWVRHAFDAYLLPALTPAGFKKRLVNRRGLAALAVLLGLTALTAFWLVPHWARHHEQKWTAQARLLLGRGYLAQAYQKAVRVLRRDAQNIEAMRVLADLLERQGLSEALTWRRKIVQVEKTSDDQLALAATAIRFEPAPSPTASRLLADLRAVTNHSARYEAVAAEYEVKRGEFSAAEAHYLAALAQNPANRETELALAVLRLSARDAAKVALARQSLDALSTQTNMAVRALRPLVTFSAARGDWASALQYSHRVLADEHSAFEDRITHLGVLAGKRDPERAAFLRTLQDQVSANPQFVAQLSTWMTANGEAHPALVWMEQLALAVRQAEPVLIATADLYAAEQDWSGMEQFLADSRWGTLEYVRQAMLARAYRGLGQPRACADSLERATDLASGMSLRLTALARLLSGWGWEREAENVIWAVAERFPDESWAGEALLRRYYERGNSEGLRQVFALQMKRSPNDLSLKNNLAMLLLLLRQELPTAHQLARVVHEQNPASAVNASTYAFSLYIQGRATEGRKILESLSSETLKAPSLAVYYAILADATGDSAAAQASLQYARLARLLPEEKAMLERIKK